MREKLFLLLTLLCFAVSGVRATSNNSVNVTRASIQESVYTFTMPSEAVTVAATFKSAIYLMTANHCTIEASVNGGTPTLVDGLVGAIGADKNDVVTLTVTPTVEGEAISQTALTYTTTGGENVTEYATKVDATNYKFTMPDDVTVTVMPISAFALADDADNSSVIGIHNGDYLDVMLQGRTLYRNGNWNTLCLPFDLKEEGWYSLDGRKLSGKPATTGLYILGSKKVYVK